MSPHELAVHDAADRLRVVDAAIAETHRGITLRLAAAACTVEPMLRNLTRLETRREQLAAELADIHACKHLRGRKTAARV